MRDQRTARREPGAHVEDRGDQMPGQRARKPGSPQRQPGPLNNRPGRVSTPADEPRTNPGPPPTFSDALPIEAAERRACWGIPRGRPGAHVMIPGRSRGDIPEQSSRLQECLTSRRNDRPRGRYIGSSGGQHCTRGGERVTSPRVIDQAIRRSESLKTQCCLC